MSEEVQLLENLKCRIREFLRGKNFEQSARMLLEHLDWRVGLIEQAVLQNLVPKNVSWIAHWGPTGPYIEFFRKS